MLRRILWLLMGLILSHTGIANDPHCKATTPFQLKF